MPRNFITPLLVLCLAATAAAQPAHSDLTLEQKEKFLTHAKVIGARAARKGITGTLRVTLSDGVITHDASVQKIDEQKVRFEGARGTEMNFRDTYKFNVAAYRVGRLLGLGNMIPPSVERSYEGNSAAFTWWVDNVIMDEGDRLKKQTVAPDKDKWARQYQVLLVFDQLIANTDRNLGNILYDQDWRLWMIDHTRAFRMSAKVLEKKSLDRCDSQLLTQLKRLSAGQVKEAAGQWIREPEIKGLLSRRDQIVAFFEADPKRLYDYLSELK